jgi:hypothetical protein
MVNMKGDDSDDLEANIPAFDLQKKNKENLSG